jgi:DNA repair protein RadC
LAAGPSRPDHGGHRNRLRHRARLVGVSALPDYELLELFLFRSIPQRDVKPLAKALLARFGSLPAALSAPLEDMLQVSAVDNKGKALRMTADIALDLALMFEATRRLVAEPLKRTTVISSWSALVSYLKVTLAHEPREQFRILFLDKKNQLIADEIMGHGTVDHAPAYPREIMRR